MKKLLFAVMMLAVFSAGYITGSIRTRDAIALELGGLTGVSGTVESLKNLGRTIIDMQKNVDNLQKNINDVKKVRDEVASYQGITDKVLGKPESEQQKQQGVSPGLQKGLQQYLTPEQKQQEQ